MNPKRHPWPRAFIKAGITPTVSAVWGPPGDESSPWRYSLSYTWGKGPRLCVIGLNPSTASPGAGPDPTVCRWLCYALAWGYSGLDVLNTQPLRATSPRDMVAGRFAIKGQPNKVVGMAPPDIRDQVIHREHVWKKLIGASLILASWGGHPASKEPGPFAGPDSLLKEVMDEGLVPVACLDITKDGEPVHPLARTAGLKLAGAWPVSWPGLEPVPTPVPRPGAARGSAQLGLL